MSPSAAAALVAEADAAAEPRLPPAAASAAASAAAALRTAAPPHAAAASAAASAVSTPWRATSRAFGPRLVDAPHPPPPPVASCAAAAGDADGDDVAGLLPPSLADAGARLRWLAAMVDGIAASAGELSHDLGALDDVMARAQASAEVDRRSAQLRSLRERADAALLRSLSDAVAADGDGGDGGSGSPVDAGSG